MSSLIAFTLLLQHRDSQQIDRIMKYLTPDTRPDFPEDVPEVEVEWVDAFEDIPYPDAIKQPNMHTLLVSFAEDDLGELPDDLGRALEMSHPSLILAYSDFEDHVLYECWQDAGFQIVWDVDNRYEDVPSVQWENEVLVELNVRKDVPEKVLLYLAEKLANS